MFLIFKVFGPLYTFVTIPYYAGPFKGGCSVNTDYMYVPIFPDFGQFDLVKSQLSHGLYLPLPFNVVLPKHKKSHGHALIKKLIYNPLHRPLLRLEAKKRH